MIKIENLNFGYSKKKFLYKNLNYEAKSGSIIGLLGKNGAGKSTLLKLLGGLIQPQNKSITVMGYVPFQRKPTFLQDVYHVPEELSIPPVSIKVYIEAVGPLYHGFDYEKFDNILKQFELNKTGKLNKLSYGQKKKFLIAFALSTNCKLLLLDEPTNGLDIPSKVLFRKVMAGALTDNQLAIISTHQVKDIENLIDRIVVVNNGQIIFDNSVYDICQHYSFHASTDLTSHNYIYHEESLEGYRGIKHKNGEETQLDIELLFNAITSGTNLEIHESDI